MCKIKINYHVLAFIVLNAKGMAMHIIYIYIYILTSLMFNISPPIGTFLLHKWMCPAMHGMLHRAPSSLIKVVSQQAESCIQALQIDMGDLTLLCTAKRVRVDSKRSNQEACCTGLYQDWSRLYSHKLSHAFKHCKSTWMIQRCYARLSESESILKVQIKRFPGIEEEWGERRKFLRRSGNGAKHHISILQRTQAGYIYYTHTNAYICNDACIHINTFLYIYIHNYRYITVHTYWHICRSDHCTWV